MVHKCTKIIPFITVCCILPFLVLHPIGTRIWYPHNRAQQLFHPRPCESDQRSLYVMSEVQTSMASCVNAASSLASNCLSCLAVLTWRTLSCLSLLVNSSFVRQRYEVWLWGLVLSSELSPDLFNLLRLERIVALNF